MWERNIKKKKRKKVGFVVVLVTIQGIPLFMIMHSPKEWEECVTNETKKKEREKGERRRDFTRGRKSTRGRSTGGRIGGGIDGSGSAVTGVNYERRGQREV
jgi:hypothetical protein